MAIQGRGPGRQPNGPSGIFEGDQDIFPTRDLFHGTDESTFTSS